MQFVKIILAAEQLADEKRSERDVDLRTQYLPKPKQLMQCNGHIIKMR